MNKDIQIDQALVKIVGVFSYDKKKDILHFIHNGYTQQPLIKLPNNISTEERNKYIQDTEQFYKNVYYKEFRGFLLTGEDIEDHKGKRRINAQTLVKKGDDNVIDLHLSNKSATFKIEEQEIYFLPGGIGIFALSLQLPNLNAANISDTIVVSREFNAKVKSGSAELEWHAWISNNVLCDIAIGGNKVHTDEFSGSKFKCYCILDLDESKLNVNYDRDIFLYEMATCSRLDEISENGYYAPSQGYLHEILSNKLCVFNNYTGLTILDSMTVIGQGNMSKINDNTKGSKTVFAYHTWNKSYFSIYIFNLFIKYNLFRLNTEFLKDPVGYRNEFQEFVNQYNYPQISFNFLPNLINQSIRQGLEIQRDLDSFENRLSKLADQIQEEQEKRQALLLGLISVLSALDALDSITQKLNDIQTSLGINSVLFYFILSLLIIICSVIAIKYLLPTLFNKMKKSILQLFKIHPAK
jgi:hypothetical protein